MTLSHSFPFAALLFALVGLTPLESQASPFQPCDHSPRVQELRSAELQRLYRGDQDDRKQIEAHLDQKWPVRSALKTAKNDLYRRRRAAEIFGEGCFKSAADYAAAAMIYQHGTVPDHYYQTFLWSKRAVELGDASQRHLMALGIDRYLMGLGHAQLFGSQARKLKENDLCWCLWPVEPTFSEKMRAEYLGKTLEEQQAWVKTINGKNACPDIDCKTQVQATPQGQLPGFW